MGVHSLLREGNISSLPPSSYMNSSSSLEVDLVSYMEMLPCLPPSYGHSLDWFLISTLIKDFLTSKKTSEVASIGYYI